MVFLRSISENLADTRWRMEQHKMDQSKYLDDLQEKEANNEGQGVPIKFFEDRDTLDSSTMEVEDNLSPKTMLEAKVNHLEARDDKKVLPSEIIQDCDALPKINDAIIEDEMMSSDTKETLFLTTTRENDFSHRDAKDALIRHAKQSVRRKNKFAKDMQVTSVHQSSVYVYTVRTMVQTRDTHTRKEACSSETTVGDHRNDTLRDHKIQRMEVDPYKFQVDPPSGFIDTEKRLEVPNTSFVADCKDCSSKGHFKCIKCQGSPEFGQIPCQYCRDPYKSFEYCDYFYDPRNSRGCTSCFGTGYQNCDKCGGNGRHSCEACQGSGKIRHCQQVIVRWRVFEDMQVLCCDFEIDYKLKNKLMMLASSDNNFYYSEEGTNVNPISNSPMKELDQLSEILLQQHTERSLNTMIVKQQHTVQRVQVAKVIGENIKPYTFYVYGHDKDVHAPKYPKYL